MDHRRSSTKCTNVWKETEGAVIVLDSILPPDLYYIDYMSIILQAVCLLQCPRKKLTFPLLGLLLLCPAVIINLLFFFVCMWTSVILSIIQSYSLLAVDIFKGFLCLSRSAAKKSIEGNENFVSIIFHITSGEMEQRNVCVYWYECLHSALYRLRPFPNLLPRSM